MAQKFEKYEQQWRASMKGQRSSMPLKSFIVQSNLGSWGKFRAKPIDEQIAAINSARKAELEKRIGTMFQRMDPKCICAAKEAGIGREQFAGICEKHATENTIHALDFTKAMIGEWDRGAVQFLKAAKSHYNLAPEDLVGKSAILGAFKEDLCRPDPFSYIRWPEKGKCRGFGYVQRMVEKGMISDEDFKNAAKEAYGEILSMIDDPPLSVATNNDYWNGTWEKKWVRIALEIATAWGLEPGSNG